MSFTISITATSKAAQLQDFLTELGAYVSDCTTFKTSVFPNSEVPALKNLVATINTDKDTAEEILEILNNANFETSENIVNNINRNLNDAES